METVTKKKIAGKMNQKNPLFQKGVSSLGPKNRMYANKMANDDLLDSPVSKYNGSVEDDVESGEGWIPGLRELFDSALAHGDKLTVKALLPQIPQHYAESFGEDINRLLRGKSSYN